MAQRQAEAPGIVVLPESARVPRHIAAAGLPSAHEIGANPSRAVRIYTWGLRVIKEGQLPAGAEDSQHTYDASVLTARKHGVTGRSQLAHMNGLDPTLQAILMEDDLFLAWLRGLITNVEAKGHRAISVVCAHGQHRSVAAAEILKTSLLSAGGGGAPHHAESLAYSVTVSYTSVYVNVTLRLVRVVSALS